MSKGWRLPTSNMQCPGAAPSQGLPGEWGADAGSCGSHWRWWGWPPVGSRAKGLQRSPSCYKLFSARLCGDRGTAGRLPLPQLPHTQEEPPAQPAEREPKGSRWRDPRLLGSGPSPSPSLPSQGEPGPAPGRHVHSRLQSSRGSSNRPVSELRVFT